MEWFYLFRLFVATALGVAIGFERKLRFKEAGMRTHSIVSLGSCLLMLISLYAFEGGDKGRVAAQIVTGIGFLGAGMIMLKHQGGIQGLTTAAGIWVTAGIGMAVGGGMYLLGVGSTVIMICIQCIFHLPFKFFRTKRYIQLKVTFEDDGSACEKVQKIFDVNSFMQLKSSKLENKIVFTVTILTDKIYNADFIRKVLLENDFIRNIDRLEND